MAHLKKSASGHLLKSADGHLVNDCGCPATVYAVVNVVCEGTCDGTWQWDRAGSEWTLTTDGDIVKGCTGGCSIKYSGTAWTLCIGACPESGPDVQYEKPGVVEDCPTGTYSSTDDSCCSNPPDITIYT